MRYDARLGRFLSADSIVPGPANPQAFNRYAYVLNRPTGLVDPSGHLPMRDSGEGGRRPPGVPKPSAHSPSQYPPAGSVVFGRRWADYTRHMEQARTVPLINNNCTADFGNAGAWSSAIDINTLPGSGDMRAQDNYELKQ